MNRIHVAAFIATLFVSTATLASGTGYRVTYNGGSLHNLTPGETVNLRIDARQVHLLEGDTEVAAIPTSAINGISYKDDATMRRADALGLALSGSSALDAPTTLLRTNQRSVILTWADGDSRGGLALQCAPADCPVVLTSLQGVTYLNANSLN
jgi:hypothetical protein